MEGDDNPETINVWELMKDLDEDETYPGTQHTEAESSSKHVKAFGMPSFEPFIQEPPGIKEGLQSRAQSTVIPTSKHATTLAKASIPTSKHVTALAKAPLDSFSSEPLDVKEFPKRPTSFQAHGNLERSFASGGEGSSRDITAYINPLSRPLRTAVSTSRVPDMSNVKFAGPTQETLTEHLQKSLSFESSAKDEMRRIFGQKDAINAFYSKELKVTVDTDASTSSSSRPLREEETLSTPSTSSSSITKNLRKWFQDDSRKTKQKQEQSRGTSKVSGHEPKGKPSPQQASSSHANAWKFAWPISKIAGASANVRTHTKTSTNVGADQNPSSSQAEKPHRYQPTTDQMRHEVQGVNPTAEVLPQRRFRRLRHSFTLGWNKEASQEKASSVNNRAISLELEKYPKVPKDSVVLYSTSAKEDGQAFEDSNAARAALISVLGAEFEERSVSQDPRYAEELMRAVSSEMPIVPTVRIKGRYITGLDNVMQMYKRGILRSSIPESIPEEPKADALCVCRGGKFLVCPVCKGKRTLTRKEGEAEQTVSCHHCSATGMIKCPNCLVPSSSA